MTFPSATARLFLFLFNVIFLATGTAIGVTAILIELSFSQHSIFVQEKLTSPPILVAISCLVISLVSIFGCCGVIKESRCILYTFSVLICAVFILEVVAGVFAYQQAGVMKDSLKSKMKELQYDYNKINETIVKRSWDVLQYDFQCCGIEKAEEWTEILHSSSLPHSCCGELPIDRTCTIKDASKLGCITLFEKFLKSKMVIVGGIAVSIGGIQLLCSMGSCLLARHLNKQYEVV
ncbi:23 kDa integral membrane protein-like [Planococcus citri]|uniref:23 kDa integral membrane protein-like n=1 Tax=Planococcus citri TaxID=170843 RepID=UPI0031F763C9